MGTIHRNHKATAYLLTSQTFWVKLERIERSMILCAVGEIRETLVPLSSTWIIYKINLSYYRKFWFVLPLGNITAEQQQLKSLPTSLATLTKLEKLDLSHNALRELPDNLGLLPSLSRLNVCGNKLRKLPVSLGSCESLTLVLATANRLVAPPQSICNEGSHAIIQWIKKNVPNGDITQHKTTTGNVFPRIRGSQLNSAGPFCPQHFSDFCICWIFTARVRSTTGCYVFTRVCLLTGGRGYPISILYYFHCLNVLSAFLGYHINWSQVSSQGGTPIPQSR